MNNFAISSDGIASGLQRSASTLVAAGNSLEQSIAMLAAGNKVMQDPEALGNALKVLSMRIRGTKTELEEAGEETDGMAENTSKLRKQVMALTNIDGNGGVDILTDSGAFRSTYDILYDIAQIWDQLNDYDPKAQAALLELLAGKTRGSQLAAILQNPEDLKAAYETAMNSAGSAMQENERYLDSIQGKIDKFTNALQTFWMDAISSDFVKGVVDIGTTLLNILDEIIKKIGLVGTAITGLGIKQVFKSFKEANNLKKFSDIFSFGKDKLFNISVVKEFFDTFKNGYNEVINMSSKIKGIDVLAELANYDDASGQLNVLRDLLKIKDENTTVSKAFVKSILEEHAAELGLNAETVQAIINSELFAASQTGAAVGTDILTAAQTRLMAVLKGVKAAFLGLLAAHPVLTIIAGMAAAIGLVYAAYKKWGPTHDNYIKKLEEETKNLKEIQENLKDLNSELETTKQRIEELESKGPLTLTEQEELDKLKEQNAELERQIKLEEAREERARNKQAKEAIGAFKTDEDFKVQFEADMEIGNAFEQKLDAIERTKKELDQAEVDLQDAYDSGIERNIKKAEKKLNKAQEAYTNAQSNWDTLMKNNEEEYGDLEWFDGENLTEAQKKVNEIISTIQNYNDRAEILFGSAGAKQSALDRLFGERGSEAGKAFNEAFKAKIESGEIAVDVDKFSDSSAAIDNVTKSVEGLISDTPLLELQLNSLGLTAEDVARYFLKIDEVVQQTSKTVTITATDISSLTSAYDSYASALQMANEIAFDGQAISEDYYNSLKEYLGDVTVGEEDFSDAIDVNNGKVVKNTKLLKNLIAQKKKEQKATVSAVKAQSQLQYSKIVKQLQQAVKVMALDYKAYGYVTQATYQNISALREQINNIKNAIKEYSLLELKLSDVTNAYTEFENAKNRDAELTYGDSLIEGIQALNDGFATGKVGSETFKAAVDLIVPKEAYEGLDDYQDRLVAIHDYVDKNPLFADWFTVDEDGNFGIEFKNMAAFVQDMQSMGVFTGDDITGFNFGDGIKSIEDIVTKTKEWNNGVGVTKETIVAMLTELSKYDGRWGDLLEELTMTDVDKAFKNTTEALDAAIAKQEQFFKDGKDPYGANANEYTAIQQEINNCSDAFDKAQQSIVNNTNAWVDANSKVETAKGKVADLTRELDQLKESDATDNEIQIKTNQLDEAKKELSDALQIKYGLEEPTQMDFQVSFESVQAQIDKWDEEHATLAVEIVPKLEQDSNGVWKIPAEVQADLSEEDLKALQERVKLTNDENIFASLINGDEIDPVVDGLTNITDILSNIYNVISGGKDLPDTTNAKNNAAKGLELRGNTTTVKPQSVAEDDKQKEKSPTSDLPGFATDSLDQKIAAFNTEINKWLDEYISQPFYSMVDGLNHFFTETLPTKWNEFWEAVGEQIDKIVVWAQGIKESIGTFFNEKIEDISTWAQEMGESISTFFTETLPQKWDEFWTWIGEKLNSFKEWAKELGNSIGTFFTETLPEKWDEFWENVGDFFKSIPYAIGYFAGKVSEFFTKTLPEKWDEFWGAVGEKFNDFKEWAKDIGGSVKDFFTNTLPEKWNEFWEEVGNALTNIKEKAIELKDKVVEFFTTTIPTKWAEFWDGVSEYISTNITPALKACWDKVVEFFTVTIPDKWNAFWNSVDTFITETIPVALTYAWDKIVEFFTVTIPEKWNGFWDAVSEYVSTNITPALTEIWNKIVDFFTVTIPEKLNQFWDDIVTFVTETVPTAIENAKDGVTTFFTETIPGKINELWDGIASWISDKATSFWEFLKSGFKSGYEDATSGKEYGASKVTGNANAKGNVHSKINTGLKSNEHNTVVGELGREMVVDPNRGIYYTVGENGTEMVDLPKGAIIYNHKQTEELLKNGQTSRGTLVNGGLSFATGNAHAYYNDGYRHGLYGGYLSDDPVFKDTSKQWVDANQNWVDDFANAADGISDAADSLSDSADEFKETINWIEVLFTRIDNTLAEHEAYLATVVDSTGGLAEKNSIYNTVFEKMYSKASYSVQAANYYQKLADSILSGMDQVIASKVRNGTILIEEITDEALKENIDKALDYLDQVSQYKQQYYSTLEEIADKAVERQEEVANAYENEIGLVEHLNNTLEARNDLEEAKNGFATEAYYKAQINANKTMLKQYKAERKALQQVFDAEVAAGNVKIGSQQWFDMQQAIYECDDAIIDMESSIEDLQNAINDLYWDRFDELINRFGYIEDEISNVIQLLSHDPDGLVMEELRDLTTTNWATGSGLASLGLYAEQMEEAQYVANQYAEQIKELKKQYAAGRYNETEYLNKLNELIGKQYENIENYFDAKNAIIELNEARVDAIRDGIQKEIDSYDELIQKKKDLLSREQDLHDFQDEIAEKEKDVSDIRKQLAAMAGDDTAATTAKRKQLEAELVEAQKSLEDSYYSHSMSARQDALDKEFSDFEEEKNAEIEKWEEWLKDTEQVVSEALDYVKNNTNEVFNTLKDLGNDYNLTMSDSLITPWQNGSNAIDNYSENFGTAVSNFTEQLDSIVLHWEDVTAAAEEAARAQAKALQAQYNKTASSVPSTINNGSSNNKPSSTSTPTSKPASTPKPTTPSLAKGSSVTVKTTATHFSRDGGNGTKMKSFVPGGTYTVYQTSGNEVLIGRNGVYTGWVCKSDLVGFAKGGIVKKNDLYNVEELGEELQIMADGKGRVSYMKTGSGVLSAPLTERLMDIANDPMSIFDGMKTDVKVPNIESKDFNFELSFDSLLHVDNASNDSIPALKKMIRTEFDSMMTQVNNKLKRV